MRWFFGTIATTVLVTLTASVITSAIAYFGWTYGVPPETKQAINVAVTVVSEVDTASLDDLSAAIRDLRELAAIEIERARAGQ